MSSLGELLEIYDEKLLDYLNWIVAIKGSIIYEFSEMLDISYDGNQISRISLKLPKEELSLQILHKIQNGAEYPDGATSMINIEAREKLKDISINTDDPIAKMVRWGQIYYADGDYINSLFIRKGYEGWGIQLALDLKDFFRNSHSCD